MSNLDTNLDQKIALLVIVGDEVVTKSGIHMINRTETIDGWTTLYTTLLDDADKTTKVELKYRGTDLVTVTKW